MSSPLKLRKTSYFHRLVEEEFGKDNKFESIELRYRSAGKKIQLELRKFKKKKIMKEEKLFDEFPSSNGPDITSFFFFLEFYEQAQLKLHSSELRGSVGIVRLNCVVGKEIGCWVVSG